MSSCEEKQSRLAEEGLPLLEQDTSLRDHFLNCPHCGAFQQRLRSVEQATSELKAVAAPDALAASALQQVYQASVNARSRDERFHKRRRRLGYAIGMAIPAALVILLAIPMYLPLFKLGSAVLGGEPSLIEEGVDFLGDHLIAPAEMAPSGMAERQRWIADMAPQPSPVATPKVVSDDELSLPSDDNIPAYPAAALPASSALEAFVENDRDALGATALSDIAHLYTGAGQRLSVRRRTQVEERQAQNEWRPAQLGSKREMGARVRLDTNNRQAGAFADQQAPIGGKSNRTQKEISIAVGALANTPSPKPPPLATANALLAKGSKDSSLLDLPVPEEEIIVFDRIQAPEPKKPARKKSSGEAQQPAASTRMALTSKQDRRVGAVRFEQRKRATKAKQKNTSRQVARAFLAERRNIDQLTFQSATGYWANTYIPGDPAMRLLEARLRAWNHHTLTTALPLAQTTRPTWQPFDAPQNAALAVYLQADQQAITGPSRLLLQVGLQGSQRQSGLRPAMNVCVVLDMRKSATRYGASLRALLTALQKARQPGDRFCLVVAGRPGGTLIASGHYRHGTVQVAIQQLFAHSKADNAKPVASLNLVEAVREAMHNVQRGDDPTATLGASLVLLASAADLAAELSSLASLAHRSAVAGVHLSVASLGGAGNPAQIDHLVRAGQGNRRILHSAADAATLIDRELHSASRAVARAVRLRIRLAPGVRLVAVLGSHRLAAPQAQRVREAEQSIDRRLARNLGIRADRGKDEEGIQIVIPNFHAGDAHVVLLDIVAPGPGALADVTVRYKDLAYLGNGIARTHLQLPQGQAAQGPLAQHVLKNLLAWRLAQSTRQASAYLSANQPQQARLALQQIQQLLAGMRLEMSGWSNDSELLADESLLQGYLDLLKKPALQAKESAHHLADALRLSAFRRLMPARQE